MRLNYVEQGDAFSLMEQLPEHSVDLIFTDPVYDQLTDYRRLAEQSIRLLKDDKPLLVWCSKKLEHRLIPLIEQVGLEHVYTLTYTVVAKTHPLRDFHLFCWSTPCLWFSKGKFRPEPWLPDTFISHVNPSSTHKWNKNVEVISKWLLSFSEPGDIVLDPFCGAGAVPSQCKRWSRSFYACDIDPEVVEESRSRVEEQMVSMLLDPGLEQLYLFDGVTK